MTRGEPEFHDGNSFFITQWWRVLCGGVGGVWVAYCCFDASASQKSSAFGLTTFRKVPKGPESGIFLVELVF